MFRPKDFVVVYVSTNTIRTPPSMKSPDVGFTQCNKPYPLFITISWLGFKPFPINGRLTALSFPGYSPLFTIFHHDSPWFCSPIDQSHISHMQITMDSPFFTSEKPELELLRSSSFQARERRLSAGQEILKDQERILGDTQVGPWEMPRHARWG